PERGLIREHLPGIEGAVPVRGARAGPRGSPRARSDPRASSDIEGALPIRGARAGLLHPRRDDLGAHIEETVHGRLLGLTPRGWFHIRRLHLNRAQLVELRQLQHVLRSQKDDLSRAWEAEARLKQENGALQGEIARLRAAIAELLRERER